MGRQRKKPILVLNSSFQIIGVCAFNDAVSKIVMGSVWSLAPSQDDFVKGPIRPDGSRYMIPWPSIIVYHKYRKIDYEHIKPVDPENATRMAILNRDNYCCAYCGGPGNELEHILPVSRGGVTGWLNCVAACRTCNSRKASRTPEEAGMKLLWHPYVPDRDRWIKEQDRVWKLLASGVDLPQEDYDDSDNS